MKVVIQCAASKYNCAGKLRSSSGEEVLFVADPERCVSVPAGMRYARPDDLCGEKAATWRDLLKHYNEQPDNPCKLFRAADLYAPKEHEFRNLYRELVGVFGWDHVFILSAGWGLIRASFWTPDYNITFSAQGKKDKPWVWRNPKDRLRSWLDFNRVHRRHQHELRRESHRAGRARNGDAAFLKRLAHGLQHAPFEFRQFIEEEHAVMCQRNFTRRRIGVAAQQSGVAGGWQRCLLVT